MDGDAGSDAPPRMPGSERGGRVLETDTHCNTPGYPGAYVAFDVPERRRPSKAATAAKTLLLAGAAFVFAWCAAYLCGV